MNEYLKARPGKVTHKDKVLAHVPKTGGINQRQLTQALNIKAQNIHRMLLELEEAGLITRSIDSGEIASNCKIKWTRK